jgi:hypothetical protein
LSVCPGSLYILLACLTDLFAYVTCLPVCHDCLFNPTCLWDFLACASQLFTDISWLLVGSSCPCILSACEATWLPTNITNIT